MMETLLTDLSSEYEDKDFNAIDGSNHRTNIPLVVIEPTITTPTATLLRKDSIVIPSISNSSISSVIQIENNNNNNALLPVCTSNSLGKIRKLENSFYFILFYFFR